MTSPDLADQHPQVSQRLPLRNHTAVKAAFPKVLAELDKNHPRVTYGIRLEMGNVLSRLPSSIKIISRRSAAIHGSTRKKVEPFPR